MSPRLLPTLLSCALSGCVDLGDEVAGLLPDERVEVDFPGARSGGRSASPAAWYTFTAQLSGDLNALAGSVPALVGAIVDGLPSHAVSGSSEAREWGPYAADGAPTETVLTVTRNTDDTGYT